VPGVYTDNAGRGLVVRLPGGATAAYVRTHEEWAEYVAAGQRRGVRTITVPCWEEQNTVSTCMACDGDTGEGIADLGTPITQYGRADPTRFPAPSLSVCHTLQKAANLWFPRQYKAVGTGINSEMVLTHLKRSIPHLRSVSIRTIGKTSRNVVVSARPCRCIPTRAMMQQNPYCGQLDSTFPGLRMKVRVLSDPVIGRDVITALVFSNGCIIIVGLSTTAKVARAYLIMVAYLAEFLQQPYITDGDGTGVHETSDPVGTSTAGDYGDDQEERAAFVELLVAAKAIRRARRRKHAGDDNDNDDGGGGDDDNDVEAAVDLAGYGE